MNLPPASADQSRTAQGGPVAKRFIVAFFTFIGLIFPAAFALALLAAPARPAPLERPAATDLADAIAKVPRSRRA